MKPKQIEYKIHTFCLREVGDEHSNSGKDGTLKKGKLIKCPNSASSNSQLGQPIIRESKSTYFVKPATTETKDQKAVIISRQMHETVANSTKYKDIKIAKQRLYNKASYKNYYPLKPLMVSKEVEGLTQKETGKDCQYQYYLGMAQIAGEPDWNPANIGNDKDGNLAVIDIGGPSTLYEKEYIGSFLFWKDLFSNATNQKETQITISKVGIDQFEDLMWVSGAIKNFHYYREEPAKMSYETFDDFIIKNTEDAIKAINIKDVYKELANICFGVESLRNKYINNKLHKKETLNMQLIRGCNKVLKNTKADSDLYKKITAYIDGATEFYYQAPNAVIEEKHILGEDLNTLKEELSAVRKSSFKDFCKLINSFNNKELNQYLEEKIELEQEKDDICTASNEHNSLPKSQSLFFSKIHKLNKEKTTSKLSFTSTCRF